MRILFIYSFHRTRETLQKILEQNSFVVDAECDPRKALNWACANSYHAVIVEHAVPQTDAETFCGALRERGCAFPLLVIVPEREAGLGTACLNRGADDFMKAPVCVLE